jgi:F0F1-type ATP synthase membrane subunit c/vacuolar-type H+-ATPase subunit K
MYSRAKHLFRMYLVEVLAEVLAILGVLVYSFLQAF